MLRRQPGQAASQPTSQSARIATWGTLSVKAAARPPRQPADQPASQPASQPRTGHQFLGGPCSRFSGGHTRQHTAGAGQPLQPAHWPPPAVLSCSACCCPARPAVRAAPPPLPPVCAAWRPSIEDASTLQLFIDFYTATQPPLSNMALECLVGGILAGSDCTTPRPPNLTYWVAGQAGRGWGLGRCQQAWLHWVSPGPRTQDQPARHLACLFCSLYHGPLANYFRL